MNFGQPRKTGTTCVVTAGAYACKLIRSRALGVYFRFSSFWLQLPWCVFFIHVSWSWSLLAHEQRDQNDDGDRDAKKKQN